MQHLKIGIITVSCLMVGLAYGSEHKPYYKTYDENGHVIYTDVKPSTDAKMKEITLSKDINVIESHINVHAEFGASESLSSEASIYDQLGMTPAQFERLSDEEKQYFRDQGFKLPESQSQEAGTKVNPQTVYEEALKKQAEGKAPQTSDWQYTVKGRRFLKPEYFERQEALQSQVDEAKSNIN